jgi:hypothetical protein
MLSAVLVTLAAGSDQSIGHDPRGTRHDQPDPSAERMHSGVTFGVPVELPAVFWIGDVCPTATVHS